MAVQQQARGEKEQHDAEHRPYQATHHAAARPVQRGHRPIPPNHPQAVDTAGQDAHEVCPAEVPAHAGGVADHQAGAHRRHHGRHTAGPAPPLPRPVATPKPGKRSPRREKSPRRSAPAGCCGPCWWIWPRWRTVPADPPTPRACARKPPGSLRTLPDASPQQSCGPPSLPRRQSAPSLPLARPTSSGREVRCFAKPVEGRARTAQRLEQAAYFRPASASRPRNWVRYRRAYRPLLASSSW